MIKIFFLIPFLFSLTSVIAQEIQKDFIIKDSLTKVKYIDYVFIPENLICPPEQDERSEMFKEYLLMNFLNFTLTHNYSSDTLLYFDGKLCPGHSTGTVEVYKISKGNVKKLFSRPGRIVNLGTKNVAVYTYPCCGTCSNIITNYSVLENPIKDTSHVYFKNASDFQVIEDYRKKNKKSSQITLKKDAELSIFWSPESLGNQRSCEQLNSNITNIFSKGSKGELIDLNPEKDWALVKFFIKDAKEVFWPDEFEKSIIDTDNYYVYGWMRVENFKIN